MLNKISKFTLNKRIIFYIILYIIGFGLLYAANRSGVTNYILLEVLNFKPKEYSHYFHFFNKFTWLVIFTNEYIILITRNIKDNSFSLKYILFLIFIYFIVSFVSPAMRIIEAHGLWHLAVSSRIIELPFGTLPDCPFLTPVKLQYPWLNYYIPIFISQITNISLSWSNVILNSVELYITFFLFRKILCHVHKDKLTQNLSTVLAFSGSYIVLRTIARYLNAHFHIIVENRISPPYHKFCLTNAMPTGICFFMVYFYALLTITLSPEKRNTKYLTAVFIGAAGVGLFYPALLFSALCCCAVSFILWVVQWSKYKNYCIIMPILVITAVLISKPYLNSIASGYSLISMVKPDLHMLLMKTVSCLITFSFTFVVFYIAKRSGWKYQGSSAKNFICMNIAGLVLCYLFLNMASINEYKSLWVAAFLFGMIAAEWLKQISMYSQKLFIALLILLSVTHFNFTYNRLFILNENHLNVSEKGTSILPIDNTEDIAIWAKNNTPVDSYWLCNDIKFPIFSGRSLYIWDENWGIQRGYSMDMLRLVCLYDEALISEHKDNANIMLNALKNNEYCDLEFDKDFYIVTDNIEVNSKCFEKVYTSDNNKYMIVKYIHQ